MTNLKENYDRIKRGLNRDIEKLENQRSSLAQEGINIHKELKKYPENSAEYNHTKSREEELIRSAKTIKNEMQVLKKQIKDAKPSAVSKQNYNNLKQKLDNLTKQKNSLIIKKAKTMIETPGKEAELINIEEDINVINDRGRNEIDNLKKARNEYLRYYWAPKIIVGGLTLLSIIAGSIFINNKTEKKELRKEVSSSFQEHGFFKTYDHFLTYKDANKQTSYQFELIQNNLEKGINKKAFQKIEADYMKNIKDILKGQIPRLVSVQDDLERELIGFDEDGLLLYEDDDFGLRDPIKISERHSLINKKLEQLVNLSEYAEINQDVNKHTLWDSLLNSYFESNQFGGLVNLMYSLYTKKAKHANLLLPGNLFNKYEQQIIDLSKTAAETHDINTLQGLYAHFKFDEKVRKNAIDVLVNDSQKLIAEFGSNDKSSSLVGFLFDIGDAKILRIYKDMQVDPNSEYNNKIKDDERYIKIQLTDSVNNPTNPNQTSYLVKKYFKEFKSWDYKNFLNNAPDSMKSIIRKEARESILSKDKYGLGVKVLCILTNSEKDIEMSMTALLDRGYEERVGYFIEHGTGYINDEINPNKFSSAFQARLLKKAEALKKQGKKQKAHDYRFFAGHENESAWDHFNDELINE